MNRALRALLLVVGAGAVGLPTASAATGATSIPGPPTRAVAWVAHPSEAVTATSRPAGGLPVYRVGTRAQWNGGPVRLLVLERRVINGTPYLRVLLPRRPNGTSGWIAQATGSVAPTGWRIEVSTRTRRVDVLRDGRVVRRFSAVVGASGTPTPHGLFAISERVEQPDASAFLGAWVLHLTGFSDVLDNYGGGPGRLALHGRGTSALTDPLGTARSHGCVRLTNAAIRWIAAHVLEGTPVRIR